MADKKLPGIIHEAYEKITTRDSEIFSDVEVFKNLYRSRMQVEEGYEYDYSLVDPHGFPVIRNYISRNNPSSAKIQLEARGPEDFKKRQINQEFINWELGEINITDLFVRMVFGGTIAGRSFAKTSWMYQKEQKIKVIGDAKEQERLYTMKSLTNRADVNYVRFQDIRIPNRNIPILTQQPYIIEVVSKRIGEMLDENKYLEESGDDYYWDKDFLKKLKDVDYVNNNQKYTVEVPSFSDSPSEAVYRASYVELLCFHTIDGELHYVPMDKTLGEKSVNKTKENPYWHGHYPYIDFTPFPEDDEFYSSGVMEQIADLQIASSEMLNQTMTNVRAVNNNMWIAGTDAAQTPDWEFMSKPNGIIRVVGDVSQVQQVRTADNAFTGLRIMQELQNRIERTSGISSMYSSGASGSQINQTARGAQIINQNMETNIEMMVDLFGSQVLKPLGEHFLELNAQYVQEDQVFYVTKKKARDAMTISPEFVSANFEVYVNSERMIKQTPSNRQASLQNLIMITNQNAKQAGVEVDMVPLFKAWYDAYPEMENIDDLVISVDDKAIRDIDDMEHGQEVAIKSRDMHKELYTLVSMHLQDHVEEYDDEIIALFVNYLEQHQKFIVQEQQLNAQLKAIQTPVMPDQMDENQLLEAMGQETMPQNVPVTQVDDDPTYNLGDIVGGDQPLL